MEKNKPIKNLKLGSIQLSIWQNSSDGKSFFSYNFDKSYLDQNQEWKKTNNFVLRDLLAVQKLLEKAIRHGIDELDNQDA